MINYFGRVNSMSFTPEEVEKNLHTDLLDYLLKYNLSTPENEFLDIHVTSDGYCTIVEWARVSYDESADTGFSYIDEEHTRARIVTFPDQHFELCFEGEADEALDNWIKAHPEWRQDERGRWEEVSPEEENSEKEETDEDDLDALEGRGPMLEAIEDAAFIDAVNQLARAGMVNAAGEEELKKAIKEEESK